VLRGPPRDERGVRADDLRIPGQPAHPHPGPGTPAPGAEFGRIGRVVRSERAAHPRRGVRGHAPVRGGGDADRSLVLAEGKVEAAGRPGIIRSPGRRRTRIPHPFPCGCRRHAMASKAIEREVADLRSELNRHNHLYYVEAQPEISDREYDRMLERLTALE